MSRRFLIAGFSFGLVGIVLGAFATHGLKPVLVPEAMASFETGVKYQIYHSLLLLLTANLVRPGAKVFTWIFFLLLAGIILFSGSIFLLSTNALTAVDFGFMGPVTPIGGSMLIVCWILLLVYSVKLKKG